VRKWWSGGLAAILLLVGALLESPGLTAQARGTSGASFTIAVLRRDGIVIPIASYGGGRWSNRWPAPGRKPDIPISVSDSPKGWWAGKRPISEWTAWPMRGDSRVIHVTGAVNLTVECQPQVGLQTDYVSAEPAEPPKMQPYPKDGLATSGDLLVEPVALLDAGSKQWAAVSADVDAKVTTAESALMRDAHFQALIPDRDRVSTPFSLEVLFGGPGPQPGTTVLYLEGVKRYAPRPGPPSGVLTYAAGFVLLEPSGPPQVDMNATLSDRRREGLVYSLVLGSFRLDGRLFWVAQRSAWGYERFDIFEIRDGKVTTVFKTAGGTC
jgi:hypothetical protein